MSNKSFRRGAKCIHRPEGRRIVGQPSLSVHRRHVRITRRAYREETVAIRAFACVRTQPAAIENTEKRATNVKRDRRIRRERFRASRMINMRLSYRQTREKRKLPRDAGPHDDGNPTCASRLPIKLHTRGSTAFLVMRECFQTSAINMRAPARLHSFRDYFKMLSSKAAFATAESVFRNMPNSYSRYYVREKTGH